LTILSSYASIEFVFASRESTVANNLHVYD